MNQPKKLIEVAMPIKEISAESVRDKSIRHGHISTLHLWWARRPLPVCRAVVFASLVPDPLDENCPQAFRDAVTILLGNNTQNGNAYKPYDDIPYTAGMDKMEDNVRNRLLMFIGKFSDTYIRNEHLGESTATKNQISEFSLIKCENKSDENIITTARKLIWVAHNSNSGKKAIELIREFDEAYKNILDSERVLYSTINRHLTNDSVRKKESRLQDSIETFINRMPNVFDPFAGGGAIPLESARLGCRSFGNDINPVAHIVQKGSLEFPQKYGKPIVLTKNEFINIYGVALWNQQEHNVISNGENTEAKIRIDNRLAFDVNFYSRRLIELTEKSIEHLYPNSKTGTKPLIYYWGRVAKCSNPSCRTEIPLLKQFYLSKKRSVGSKDYIFLNPIYKERKIEFEIKNGLCEQEGWNKRTNISCPICGNITDTKKLKLEFTSKRATNRLLAVIEEDNSGKRIFRLPRIDEKEIIKHITNLEIPKEPMQVGNNRNFNTPGWGISTFGEMFTDRQLFMMNALIDNFKSIKQALKTFHDEEYSNSLLTYVGILIDRIAARNTSLGVWHILQETVEHPFGRQAIPMVFDFPEMYPFSNLSGGAYGQLDSILNYITEESHHPFPSKCLQASSGDRNQFDEKYLTAVITDPPYYDAIAYADLSDFFYVWLKRSLGDVYPLNFATPQTPKTEECTALKHHHNNDFLSAKKHFESKLKEIFSSINHQTSDIISVMFAHQSTEAWTTLCNSILGSGMNITGSWANDTEVTGALKNEMAVLSSSVTVACKPVTKHEIGDYQVVRKEIEKTLIHQVGKLYQLGFRGADLLTACFGQAVSVFGKYYKVEKADGNEVTVAELLEIAKESAFNALLKGFKGDDFTKFYIGWLQLFGFTESDFDDAAKFSRVGLSIDVADLFKDHILTKNGNKQSLAGFKERNKSSKYLGDKSDCHLIDQVHRTMMLSIGKDRKLLLHFIAKVASNPDSAFWRVVTSLVEVLPPGSDDHKASLDLLANKDNLIRESRNVAKAAGEQSKLEF